MAYSSIVKPEDYFNTVLYTGNGSTQSITGVGFQPDWVWIKGRSVAAGSNLSDSVRGVNKQLQTASTAAEETLTTCVTAFDSDGFSLGSNGNVNTNSGTFVAWNWLAGGSASSNSNGSITSSVSANTTAGFSIVSYTGTGSVATVGHGLGVAPKFIIVKTRSLSGEAWPVDSRAASGILYLNETGAKGSYGDSSPFPSTAPTSTVFSIGTPNNTNGSGATYIAYCFADVKGYSKFGIYIGNNNASGPFIYTGFRPAWVLVKRANGSGNNWQLHDIKRTQYTQPINHRIAPNVTLAEQTGDTLGFEFFSNGFRPNNANGDYNDNLDEYIYMAFAEHPFVANNSGTAVPVVAR